MELPRGCARDKLLLGTLGILRRDPRRHPLYLESIPRGCRRAKYQGVLTSMMMMSMTWVMALVKPKLTHTLVKWPTNYCRLRIAFSLHLTNYSVTQEGQSGTLLHLILFIFVSLPFSSISFAVASLHLKKKRDRSMFMELRFP